MSISLLAVQEARREQICFCGRRTIPWSWVNSQENIINSLVPVTTDEHAHTRSLTIDKSEVPVVSRAEQANRDNR